MMSKTRGAPDLVKVKVELLRYNFARREDEEECWWREGSGKGDEEVNVDNE